MDDLRVPIGRFTPRQGLSAEEHRALIDEVRGLPVALATAVSGLNPEQLETPYRPEGWTVRQVVHHLADSHMHSYIRFKLAATEEEPPVVGYDEVAWAALPDGRDEEIGVSLSLLSALHHRWTRFLDSLDEAGLQRTFLHPERGPMTLEFSLQLYAWHGRHHVAHITSLRERHGW